MMFSRASQRGRARSTAIEAWPAPRKGWVASQRIVNPDKEAAEVLDNWFPTAEGARVRRGCALYATLGAAVKQMAAYISGSQQEVFATTTAAVFDITTVADATVTPLPVIRGFTSGSWSYAQFATSGGDFLVMVNGADTALLYDGTDWNPLNGAAVNEMSYDALVTDFAVGETVTGGTSGASAPILAIVPTSATEGVLKLGAVSSGPFQDNEALTSATGEAVAASANSEASAITATGVATSSLSFVWPHKSRLWFVQEDTLTVRYLPSGAVGGALTAFSLAGVFQYGGSVLLGGTISADSGDGMDDRWFAVTTEGEVAVYAGTDPASASTWALEGVYRIGKPLSRFAWFKAGGDFVICTEDGIASLLQAINRDRAALIEAAISRPIEDAWQNIVARRQSAFPFTATLWHSQTLLMIGTPTEDSGNPQCFVANARTGAWARYTGWDVQCSVVHQDQLYFGQSDGRVALAEVGGQDFTAPYFSTWVPKFSECGSTDHKMSVTARLILRVDEPTQFRITGLSDYALGNIQSSAAGGAVASSSWGSGTWGTSIWGGDRNALSQSQWQSIGGQGFSLSPAVVVGMGRVGEPAVEIAAVHLQYERGNPL